MKKIFVKLASAVLSALMVFSVAAGCSQKTERVAPNTATDIQVEYWNAGLGRAWLDKIIERFEELYPQYNVEFHASEVLSEINANLMGETSDTVDVYLTYFDDASYEKYYSCLDTDLLDKSYGNETKTLRQKFNQNILDQEKRTDGKIYTLSYGGGYSSICYNTDIIDGTAYEVPNTSNELMMLTFQLKQNNITPWVHFAPEGYAQYLASAWQAQYDGLNYYNNNFLTLTDPVTGESPSKEIMLKKDGRWEAIEAMAEIFTPDTVLNNSNTMDHTNAQTRFLNGQAAMMINGMWMMNEMEYSGKDNIAMMRTPVISSIVDNCDSIKGENGGTADNELSALIDDIDAVTDGEKTITLTGDDTATVSGEGYSVTEKDYKRVQEARSIMYSNAVEHSLMIPTYSVAKEGALLFAQFLYSDEALKIYFDETHFSYPVYFSDESITLDQSSWSGFEKQLYQYYLTSIPISNRTCSRSEIFSLGGIDDCANVQIINQLTARGAAKQTAAQIWTQIETAINKDWTTWMSDAGLSATA